MISILPTIGLTGPFGFPVRLPTGLPGYRRSVRTSLTRRHWSRRSLDHFMNWPRREPRARRPLNRFDAGTVVYGDSSSHAVEVTGLVPEISNDASVFNNRRSVNDDGAPVNVIVEVVHVDEHEERRG